jgi:hypothetical protein
MDAERVAKAVLRGGFFFGAAMGNAPYEVAVSGTDDETFTFSLPFENEDGSAFPFSDYTIEYAVSCDGRPSFTLTQSTGITVQSGVVTFASAPRTLRPGRYTHACRIKSVANGTYTQVFDGPVSIDEGGF